MSALERLGSMDMTWLQIEQKTNLMQVLGLLILETPLDRSVLEERLRKDLLPLERFSQQVLRDTAGAVWETHQVELNVHIVEVVLPAGDEKAALESLIGTLAATPLDPARPLWQVHLIRSYRGGSALIARVHHCIADSIALIGVLRTLTDSSPNAAEALPTASAPPPAPSHFDKLYAPLTRTMVEGIKLSGAFWAKYWSLVFNPQQAFDYARATTALTLEIGKLNGLQDDSRTLFKAQPLGVKRASWSPPLSGSNVASIAADNGTTTNAVLLACLTGALHDYLAAQGASTAGVELRTLMPVNLRNEDSEEPLGNRSGLIPIELPVGIADPKARLEEMHLRVQDFSRTYEAQRTLGLFSLIGQTPRAVQLQALKLLANKSSALLCHVPGSHEPRYLAGAKIIEEMFWSPASGEMGLTISIVSYDGHYQIGVLADAAMVAAPSDITNRVEAELLALKPSPAPARKPARRAPRKLAPT